MKTHIRQIRNAVTVVFRNRDLRRQAIALFFFNGAEWAVWIAMIVYAYDQGGATMAGIVALIQLVPAALFAPFASVLPDGIAPPSFSPWRRASQWVRLRSPGTR